MIHIPTRNSRKTAFLVKIFSLILAASTLCSASADAARHDAPDIRDGIVKIYTVYSEPYYFNPWMNLPANSANGSGCIINGRRILTNAHVVANNTFIEVRKYGDSVKYRARVLNVSHEADLALLTVDDESFFTGTTPLKLGKLPKIHQAVSAYGFPGGETLTITKGTLLKLEHQKYKHSSGHLFAGQISAAIKPGNSGGPVVIDDHIVGIVMQASNKGDRAHMVPIPVIHHFLEDIEDGVYDGIPDLGMLTQNMENPYLKEKYGLYSEQTGVLINRVLLDSPVAGKIQQDDILLAINGHLIEDNGTIEFRPKERTHYSYLIQSLQIGNKANVDVLRSGKIHNLNFTLNHTVGDYRLIPTEQYDQKPRYFIFAGIIFSQLTKNFINSWEGAPEELIVEMSNWPSKDRQEVVVALQVLPAEINKGYHNITSWIVSEVNDKNFRDFNEFYHLVTNSAEPFVVFKNRQGYQITIDRSLAEESHKNILMTYGIKEDRSSDLMNFHAADYGQSTKFQ